MKRQYSLELGRQLFIGPTPRGPWRLDPASPVTEARQHPKRKRRKTMSRKPTKKPEFPTLEDRVIMMRDMGYEAAAQRLEQELQEERQRRKVREQIEKVALEAPSPEEIDFVADQVKEQLRQIGREGGAPSIPDLVEKYHATITAVLGPDDDDDDDEDVSTPEGFLAALQGTGRPAKGRRCQEFLEALQDSHIIGGTPWM
jgi:hypothetical protein